MIIAIDGSAGTGKSTIAKAVAAKLGFLYLDTGAMYRAVTYGLLRDGINIDDIGAVGAAVKNYKIDIRLEDGNKRYFLNNEDVTTPIRSEMVTQKVSPVSAVRQVREYLVQIQRRLAENQDAVCEGRDMGTVVFPQAEVKVFLTARADVRAQRRMKDLQKDDPIAARSLTHDELATRIVNRDKYDSSREESPLKQAPDAHLIDTSDLTIEEVQEKILELVRHS